MWCWGWQFRLGSVLARIPLVSVTASAWLAGCSGHWRCWCPSSRRLPWTQCQSCGRAGGESGSPRGCLSISHGLVVVCDFRCKLLAQANTEASPLGEGAAQAPFTAQIQMDRKGSGGRRGLICFERVKGEEGRNKRGPSQGRNDGIEEQRVVKMRPM